MIEVWTDGSASPNPGPGGFAVICDGEPVALGREDGTTNIRMEARALLAALDYVEKRGEEAVINTDSEFWINVLTKWAPKWEKSGWVKKRGEIKNLELVQELYEAYEAARGRVRLNWVQGHVGTEENELADEWANKARKGAEV